MESDPPTNPMANNIDSSSSSQQADTVESDAQIPKKPSSPYRRPSYLRARKEPDQSSSSILNNRVLSTKEQVSYKKDCSICLTIMIDPSKLPCDHTFCKRCI